MKRMRRPRFHGPGETAFRLHPLGRFFGTKRDRATRKTLAASIFLNDCDAETTDFLNRLLGEETLFLSDPFDENGRLDDFRMAILEAGSDQERRLEQIGKLRRACNFRNVPIVLIKKREDRFPVQPCLEAGATEVLSLEDPAAASRQILQGLLAPVRKPMENEMEFLSPFIDNACRIVEETASQKAEFKEAYFTDAFRIYGDVSGMVGLSGHAEGILAISLARRFARKIISNITDGEAEKIHAECIYDSVAELVERIAASSKKDLEGTPYRFDLSLPTVFVGPGPRFQCPEGAGAANVVFDADQGSFALHVCLEPKAEEI